MTMIGPRPGGRSSGHDGGGSRHGHAGRRRTEGIQLPLLPDLEIGSPTDRVPELTHYRDEGCRFWHACLTCPFPRCVFEDPGGPRRAAHAARDAEIRRRRAAGESVESLGRAFQITRRTVYRALEERER